MCSLLPEFTDFHMLWIMGESESTNWHHVVSSIFQQFSWLINNQGRQMNISLRVHKQQLIVVSILSLKRRFWRHVLVFLWYPGNMKCSVYTSEQPFSGEYIQPSAWEESRVDWVYKNIDTWHVFAPWTSDLFEHLRRPCLRFPMSTFAACDIIYLSLSSGHIQHNFTGRFLCLAWIF